MIFYLQTSKDGLVSYYSPNLYENSIGTNKAGEPVEFVNATGDKRDLPSDAPTSFLVPKDADIEDYDAQMKLTKTEDGTYTLGPA